MASSMRVAVSVAMSSPSSHPAPLSWCAVKECALENEKVCDIVSGGKVGKDLRVRKPHAPPPARSIGVSLGWGSINTPQQFAISTLLDASPVGKVTLTELFTMVDQLNQECQKNAQLAKEAAAWKAKVSSLQSSLNQAEQAKEASADIILRLQAEVASAEHLDRLARGNEFLSLRKEAASLSDRVGTLTMKLKKLQAERDALHASLQACQTAQS